MSMFSTFDAFSAESLGHKVNFFWPSVTGLKKEAKVPGSSSPSSGSQGAGAGAGAGAGTSDVGSNGKDGIKKPEVNQRPRRQPRFAVELDGVHCFETIIPY